MQLGIIGLGRMGGNIARRLARAGHQCVVFDQNAGSVKELADEGMSGVAGLDALVKQLTKPRAIWLMARDAVSVDPDNPRLVRVEEGALDDDG